MKFTKESILAEILERQGTEEILAKHNLPCLHCPISKFEAGSLKIGQVCEMYGLDSESLLKELNKKIKKTNP